MANMAGKTLLSAELERLIWDGQEDRHHRKLMKIHKFLRNIGG